MQRLYKETMQKYVCVCVYVWLSMCFYQCMYKFQTRLETSLGLIFVRTFWAVLTTLKYGI